MKKISYVVTFLPVLLTPPNIELSSVKMPTDFTSAETMDPTKVPAANTVKDWVLQSLDNGKPLFGNMVLDRTICENIPAEWYLAYYLNIRYSRPVPVEMMPVRMKNYYNANDWILAPLLIGSVILTKLYDDTATTIDPTIKREHDWIRRCLQQVNYVILKILSTNPDGRRPSNKLIVSSASVIDPRGVDSYTAMWFDAQALDQWEQSGKTVEQAMDHWVQLRTQPNA